MLVTVVVLPHDGLAIAWRRDRDDVEVESVEDRRVGFDEEDEATEVIVVRAARP